MLRFRVNGLAALAAIALLLGCGDAADDSGGVEPIWSEAFDTSETFALFGVWGSAPDDVYIVGGTDRFAVIHHFDGEQWREMEAPDVRALIWITGFAADDIYAVGLGGAVVHYDGNEWTVLDSGTGDDLWGIFGFDRDEMWIVGGDPFKEEPIPTMLRFDAEAETFDDIPVDAEANSRDARSLFKVWGIGDTLFAAGQRGQILQYDGSDWVNSPGGGEADQDFVALWGTSEDNIVMVGGRSNARLATWDGERWTTRQESGLGGLNGVHMLDPAEAIIGGVEGFVGRYDVESEEIIAETQDVTTYDIHAVWGDGAGKHYAVAGDFLPPYEGAALVRSVE